MQVFRIADPETDETIYIAATPEAALKAAKKHCPLLDLWLSDDKSTICKPFGPLYHVYTWNVLV